MVFHRFLLGYPGALRGDFSHYHMAPRQGHVQGQALHSEAAPRGRENQEGPELHSSGGNHRSGGGEDSPPDPPPDLGPFRP